MKRQLTILTSRLTVILSVVFLAVQNVYAVETVQSGANSARGADQPLSLFGSNGTFSTITNVLLYVIGAIAVIMIVIGGLRYVLSGGDSNQITAAKNTILYAVIGIIVAILAYAVVNFVVGSFATGTGSSGTSV